MIVYDLECRLGGHRFEGWFGSSDDFERQQERGLVSCPHCGSMDVAKAVQAPRLTRKGNQLAPVPRKSTERTASSPSSDEHAAPMAAGPLPAQAVELMQRLAVMQAEALRTSRNVGEKFTEEARAMHYGERDAEAIHGQASLEDAQEMLEEGIAVLPLPFPVVPPEQAN